MRKLTKNQKRASRYFENILIKETNRLLNEINKIRLQGNIPPAAVTDRFAEVTGLLIDIRKQPPVFSEYARSEGV